MVLYCQCNQAGAFLEAEGSFLRSTWKRYENAVDNWRQRLGSPEESERLRDQGPVYQLQLFIEGNRPLTNEERESVNQLFFEAVRNLRKQMYSAGLEAPFAALGDRVGSFENRNTANEVVRYATVGALILAVSDLQNSGAVP
jgi:hypothetical protein